MNLIQNNVTTMTQVRPVYYLGGKGNLVSEIEKVVNEVDPLKGGVVDLFAGTGIVSRYLQNERDVMAVDIQEYSRVLCEASLRPAVLSEPVIEELLVSVFDSDTNHRLSWCLQPLIELEADALELARQGEPNKLIRLLSMKPLISMQSSGGGSQDEEFEDDVTETLRRLLKYNLETSVNSTVTRYFGGVYFSFAQSVALDCALARASLLSKCLGNTLKAAAMSAASAMTNTVGKHFAQPIQLVSRSGDIKMSAVAASIRNLTIDPKVSLREALNKYALLRTQRGLAEIRRQDYREAINDANDSYSVFYADPPYTRDHYSRFYHVLETMCLRDNPEVSMMVSRGVRSMSKGVYREERYQSPFCIKSQAPKAFDDLFGAVSKKERPLILSYSPHQKDDGTHPRVISIEALMQLACKHFKNVELFEIDGFRHNKLNSRRLALEARECSEVIFKCQD